MIQSEHAIEFSIKYIFGIILDLKHFNSGVVEVEMWFDWTALLFFTILYFIVRGIYRMYKNK